MITRTIEKIKYYIDIIYPYIMKTIIILYSLYLFFQDLIIKIINSPTFIKLNDRAKSILL
jgi:hypothetical protein